MVGWHKNPCTRLPKHSKKKSWHVLSCKNDEMSVSLEQRFQIVRKWTSLFITGKNFKNSISLYVIWQNTPRFLEYSCSLVEGFPGLPCHFEHGDGPGDEFGVTSVAVVVHFKSFCLGSSCNVNGWWRYYFMPLRRKKVRSLYMYMTSHRKNSDNELRNSNNFSNKVLFTVGLVTVNFNFIRISCGLLHQISDL